MCIEIRKKTSVYIRFTKIIEIGYEIYVGTYLNDVLLWTQNRIEKVLAHRLLELWPVYNQLEWIKMVE